MSARVFQANAVTVAIAPEGASLYAGAHEVKLFRSFEVQVNSETGLKKVVVKYLRSNDEKVRLKMEEEQRALLALGWVEVR